MFKETFHCIQILNLWLGPHIYISYFLVTIIKYTDKSILKTTHYLGSQFQSIAHYGEESMATGA